MATPNSLYWLTVSPCVPRSGFDTTEAGIVIIIRFCRILARLLYYMKPNISSIEYHLSDDIMGRICVLSKARKWHCMLSQLNAFQADSSVVEEYINQGEPCLDMH